MIFRVAFTEAMRFLRSLSEGSPAYPVREGLGESVNGGLELRTRSIGNRLLGADGEVGGHRILRLGEVLVEKRRSPVAGCLATEHRPQAASLHVLWDLDASVVEQRGCQVDVERHRIDDRSA